MQSSAGRALTNMFLFRKHTVLPALHMADFYLLNILGLNVTSPPSTPSWLFAITASYSFPSEYKITSLFYLFRVSSSKLSSTIKRLSQIRVPGKQILRCTLAHRNFIREYSNQHLLNKRKKDWAS